MTIKKVKECSNNLNNQENQNSFFQKRRSAKALKGGSIGEEKEKSDSVDIKIKGFSWQGKKGEAYKAINNLVNCINLSTTSAKNIKKILNSLEGIIEQAEKSNLSKDRRNILIKEAKELIKAVQKVINGKDLENTRKSLLTTLDDNSLIPPNIIPPNIIEKIEDSVKEINKVKACFEKIADNPFELRQVWPRGILENLEKNLNSALTDVKSLEVWQEIAEENQKAASNKLKDVEEAITLAISVQKEIITNPFTAIEASKPSADRVSKVLE